MPGAAWNKIIKLPGGVTIEHLHTSRDQQLTLSSLSGPFVARMLSFWRSCTINPQNLLNVLGSRTDGLTCIRTFLCVCMNRPYTQIQWDLPQLCMFNTPDRLARADQTCRPTALCIRQTLCHKQQHCPVKTWHIACLKQVSNICWRWHDSTYAMVKWVCNKACCSTRWQQLYCCIIKKQQHAIAHAKSS